MCTVSTCMCMHMHVCGPADMHVCMCVHLPSCMCECDLVQTPPHPQLQGPFPPHPPMPQFPWSLCPGLYRAPTAGGGGAQLLQGPCVGTGGGDEDGAGVHRVSPKAAQGPAGNCTHACRPVHTHAHAHAHMHACRHTPLYMRTHTHTHTCIHTQICTHACADMYMYTHTHICWHTPVHAHRHTHTHLHVCARVHAHTHTPLSPHITCHPMPPPRLDPPLIGRVGVGVQECPPHTYMHHYPKVSALFPSTFHQAGGIRCRRCGDRMGGPRWA